jgi:protein O-mannosyl-transferase
VTDAAATSRPGPCESPGVLAPRWRLASLLLLLATSFVLYGKSLTYPFVLDDTQVIAGNDFLHHPGNPLSFFVSDYSRGAGFGPGYFRPLMMASFWLQGSLLGWNPAWFHAVNVALHGAAAWALGLVAAELGCATPIALLGALLFAVYPPGHVAVGSVVARCDLLAALFLLLAWRTQIRRERGLITTSRAAGWIFVWSFLAMLGKENGMLICGLVPLTAVLFSLRRNGHASGREGSSRVVLCAAVLGALLAYGALRHEALRNGPTAAPPDQGSSLLAAPDEPQRIGAALYLTGRQLIALLVPITRLSIPVDLSPLRGWPRHGLLGPRVILPAMLLLLGGAAAIALLRRRSLLFLPLALLLLGLLPTSGLLVPLLSLPAEYHLYLPSAGVVLFTALAAEAGRRRAGSGSMRRAALPAVLLLAGLGWMGSSRLSAWRSEEALMEDWAGRFPYSSLVWNRLGLAALRRGDLDEARRRLEHSVELDPDNPRVLAYLGQILARQGLSGPAVARLQRAVGLLPADAALRVELGRLYLSLGLRGEALQQAAAAYGLAPGSYGARLLLASARYETGGYEEAAGLFRILVEEDPRDAAAQQGLLLSLDRAGHGDEAETDARQAARQLPDHPLFELWLARFAARAGRFDEAIDHLRAGAAHGGPVGTWLREVDDLAALRDDPRLAPLTRDSIPAVRPQRP